MSSLITKAQGVMENKGIDAWLISTHGDKIDPYFGKLVTDREVSAYLIITRDSVHMIVSSLDKDKFTEDDYSSFQIYTSGDEALRECLENTLRVSNPSNLALNYSSPEINDVSVDVLGHGEFESIRKAITGIIPDIQILSAEEIIYGLEDVKSPEDIKKLKIAQIRADAILRKVFTQIQEGMTEQDVAQLVLEEMKVRPIDFDTLGIVDEKCSWGDPCPIVLTGKNWEKGGHATTSDTIIQKGNTVYFDFGVQLTFQDGSKWSSDIQRVGYFLREGEDRAPENIQSLFDTIKTSIDTGIKGFIPGMTGEEADTIVRKVVNEQGYDYDHATGHPIGENAHGPGVIIGAKNSRRVLQLNDRGVYTIEPRIAVENGISVEEMVVVTSEGNYVIGNRQEKLILIR